MNKKIWIAEREMVCTCFVCRLPLSRARSIRDSNIWKCLHICSRHNLISCGGGCCCCCYCWCIGCLRLFPLASDSIGFQMCQHFGMMYNTLAAATHIHRVCLCFYINHHESWVNSIAESDHVCMLVANVCACACARLDFCSIAHSILSSY